MVRVLRRLSAGLHLVAEEALRGCRKQLEEYAEYCARKSPACKGKEDDPLVGEPIGAEALAAAIRYEFMPYTADELIAMGSGNWPGARGK